MFFCFLFHPCGVKSGNFSLKMLRSIPLQIAVAAAVMGIMSAKNKKKKHKSMSLVVENATARDM